SMRTRSKRRARSSGTAPSDVAAAGRSCDSLTPIRLPDRRRLQTSNGLRRRQATRRRPSKVQCRAVCGGREMTTQFNRIGLWGLFSEPRVAEAAVEVLACLERHSAAVHVLAQRDL